MQDDWQAASARHHFSELIDAAVAGRPQFVRRRDGREVVVVSREYFEQTKPDLKTTLLTKGYASGDDADEFDEILREIRTTGGATFGTQTEVKAPPRDARSRHGRSK